MKVVITKTYEIEMAPKNFFDYDAEVDLESVTPQQVVDEVRSWTSEIGWDDPVEGFINEWGLDHQYDTKKTRVEIDGVLLGEA